MRFFWTFLAALAAYFAGKFLFWLFTQAIPGARESRDMVRRVDEFAKKNREEAAKKDK